MVLQVTFCTFFSHLISFSRAFSTTATARHLYVYIYAYNVITFKRVVSARVRIVRLSSVENNTRSLRPGSLGDGLVLKYSFRYFFFQFYIMFALLTRSPLPNAPPTPARVTAEDPWARGSCWWRRELSSGVRDVVFFIFFFFFIFYGSWWTVVLSPGVLLYYFQYTYVWLGFFFFLLVRFVYFTDNFIAVRIGTYYTRVHRV